MACITVPTALAVGGGLSAASSLGGSLISSGAATSAAKTQAQAAQAAAGVSQNIYNQTRTDLYPFISAGQDYSKELYSDLVGPGNSRLTSPLPLIPPGSATFAPTEATLEATPGYQFTKQQGLKAVQNSLAASGLGSGGPAAVGAAKYATGLADTTFQDQFSNWLNTQNLSLSSQSLDLQQRQLLYNMLTGQAQLGESAAAQTGGIGTQISGQVGNAVQAAGAAQAAGTVGSANALTAGLTGVGNAGLSTAALLALTGGGGASGGSGLSAGIPFNTDTTSTRFGTTS